MTAANRLGLYSAFLACNAIFFRSSFTPMLTVLDEMWSSSWRLNVKESKPNNVLELRNDFWGRRRLVGCRRWRRWWGYWSIHWPFKKKWLSCLAHHPHHLSIWCIHWPFEKKVIMFPTSSPPHSAHLSNYSHPAPNSCLWALPCSRTEEREACGVWPVDS